MKTFSIVIQETLSKNVEIEAENLNEAFDKAGEMYENEEIVLDAGDFLTYEIKQSK